MTVEFEATEKEVKRASDLVERARYGAANSKVKFYAIMLVLFGLMGLRIYSEMIERGSRNDLLLLGALAAITFFILRFRKRVEGDDLAVSTTMTVADDALHDRRGTDRFIVRWTDFSELIDTPEFLLLKRKDKSNYYWVPKRAFPGSETADAFRDAIRERICLAPISATACASEPIAPSKDQQQLKFILSLVECADLAIASWVVRGLWLLLFVSMLAGMAIRDRSLLANWKDTAPLMAATILFFAAFIWALRTLAFYAIYRAIGPQVIRIGDEMISIQTAAGEESMAWTRVTSFKETRLLFIFWRNGTRWWLAIPKRVFARSADVNMLRDMLRARLQRSIWFFH